MDLIILVNSITFKDVVLATSGVLIFFSFYIGKILVLLRDGRKLLGTLCSFDQFGTFLPNFPLLPNNIKVHF